MIRRLVFALSLAVLSLPAFAQAPDQALRPSVLSQEDVIRYRKIIAAERAGNFATAEKLFDAVDDKSLQGYVEAEHYLSPKSKRVPVTTLVAWLKQYGELPIAPRIHKLAEQRAVVKKKVGKKHHRRTVTVVTARIPGLPGAQRRGGGYEDADLPLPPVTSDAGKRVLDQITTFIKADQPEQADAVLQSLAATNTAPANDIAALSQRVCQSYLAEGMDEQAFALGEAGANMGRQYAPQLDWCAGIAAFRLEKFAIAASHFEQVAQLANIPGSNRSAAAFWAARSYMRAGDPRRVVTLLTVAAKDQPTFYGLLAEKLLGEDIQRGFSDPLLLPNDFQTLMQNGPAHRAVALWQVGEKKYDYYVNTELNRAFGMSASLNCDMAFAALARAMGVPNLELRASETSFAKGKVLTTGLFPFPPYEPTGGYTIDPSLVLAFVRIETRFQPNAVSPVGAMGLMQLMPATARLLGGASAEDDLLNPSYNMALGQRFIARLLKNYNGSIVQTAAAYNAGPGKVKSWTAARAGKEDDSLMFIESMRAPETRSYAKRLLIYYWMYHRRDDKRNPSLDDTARGGWPIYQPPQQSAPPPPPANTNEDDDEDDETPSS
ncbi:soluble lytic murein transglycosylase-like protein [Rhizomicrobium palustre]|uniref:Soluble lytic murein transglycosylase-like protein n=1 Tax=Rhizomicrobium palustre TaxID=189966 RepID=A0A846N343_9PROT|nr:lytic transglycosylase domain-containing protein [Rhizomicrobium palustre]NIK90156.1 soluble lytic murein transglycosylase-like protein [Rhizomicrobium palustre]